MAEKTIDELYPEHAKLMKISDQSQAIGNFLDYGPYTLCEHREIGGEDVLLPVSKSIQTILAEHFDIDLNEIEIEKRQMLNGIRSA